MNAYQEAALALTEKDVIYSSVEYRRIIANLLKAPVDFTNDSDAEDYVLKNPHGVANVIQKRIVVTTYFGKKNESEAHRVDPDSLGRSKRLYSSVGGARNCAVQR